MKKKYESMTPSEDSAAAMLDNINPEGFLEIGVKSFQLYMGDPLIMKIWRIISIERFRNDRAKDFFLKELMDNPIRYQATIFAAMMKKGKIKKSDPVLLAQEFYSYILYIYFRFFELEPERNMANDPEVTTMIRNHMAFFSNAMKQKEA